MSDMIGQRIGAYEIVSLLGKGGMAQVYRARQQLGGKVARDVALKLIDARLSMSDEFIARFEREAQTLVTLSHPHILKAFDYGQYNETVYLVMELLPGGSLAQLIKKGLLPMTDVSKWLDQIGQALDYAHRQGIVHRDMKPQNVLLDNEGNAFLTDFGIVKLLGETSSLTQSNTSIGTPAYMAPEQWTSGRVDARTDLYAFGVMLFEMVGGHVPFTGDTPFRVMYLHTNEPPPSIYSLRPDLPSSLDRVITKALAKDPMARYESAAAMVSDFRAAMVGAAVTAPPILVAPPANIVPESPSSISGPIPNNRTVILPSSKPGLPVSTSSMPPSQAGLPQAAAAPASGSRLPLIIGLVAAAILAVVTGGVVATVLLAHNNPPTATAVVENTTAAPASTAVVAVAPTTQAPASTIEVAIVPTTQAPTTVPTTAVPTSSSIPSVVPTTVAPTASAAPATNTPLPTDKPLPTTTVPTSLPEPTATVLDNSLLLQTALARALTQTATQWTLTPTLTFTPSETPTITPTETATLTATPTNDVMATAVQFANLTNTAVFQVAALNTQNALPTMTYTPSLSPTPTLTSTPSLTFTLSPTVTNTASITFTPRPSATSSSTPPPTRTRTPVPTKTDTPVPTATLPPTDTAVPTDTPVPTNTPVPTSTITPKPTITLIPSKTNTPAPTVPPTHVPLDVIAATATARAAGGAPATDTPFYNGDALLPSNMAVSFSEQFYDNSNKWAVYSKPNVGAVQIADNQLQYAVKPNAYMEVIAPANAPSVTDFYFRTFVTYTAPAVWATTSFGLIIHRTAVGYDFIDIRPGTCIFALNTYTAKTNAYVALNFKNACQSGSPLTKLTSFVFTVVGNNNQFTVYIDNVKEAVLADTAKVYTSGQLGLYVSSSQTNGFNLAYTDIAIAQ